MKLQAVENRTVGGAQREGHEALAHGAGPVGARHQLLPHIAALVEADAAQTVQVVLQRYSLACVQSGSRFREPLAAEVLAADGAEGAGCFAGCGDIDHTQAGSAVCLGSPPPRTKAALFMPGAAAAQDAFIKTGG